MAVITIDWNPTRKVLRNFGFIGLVAFAGFGALFHWQIGPLKEITPDTGRIVAYVLLALAAYCGLFAVAAPVALKPIYILLTVVTYPIGFVLSYIVMAILFYLIITPVGLLFKIIGRDALHRRFEPQVKSYWIKRRPPDTVKRYFRQF